MCSLIIFVTVCITSQIKYIKFAIFILFSFFRVLKFIYILINQIRGLVLKNKFPYKIDFHNRYEHYCSSFYFSPKTLKPAIMMNRLRHVTKFNLYYFPTFVIFFAHYFLTLITPPSLASQLSTLLPYSFLPRVQRGLQLSYTHITPPSCAALLCVFNRTRQKIFHFIVSKLVLMS